MHILYIYYTNSILSGDALCYTPIYNYTARYAKIQSDVLLYSSIQPDRLRYTTIQPDIPLCSPIRQPDIPRYDIPRYNIRRLPTRYNLYNVYR